MIKQALISVSDKTGVLDFARALASKGVAILSTGGTAKLLADNGVAVTEVADYTGFPEMLDGRVKTLHPKVHGGILARRDFPDHVAKLAEHAIPTIDMVVVNLYPFQQTVAKDNCSLEDAIENIDIGGPTMLRSAAKNHRDVVVVCDPADYAMVLADMDGEISYDTRFMLAKKVFAHTAQYDGAITNYLTSLGADRAHATRAAFPQTLNMTVEKVQDMRYGENPHQGAAFYRDLAPAGNASRPWAASSKAPVASSSSTPTRAAWRSASMLSTPTAAPCKPIRPRPSAASSPSMSKSMARPPPRSPNCSSKCSSPRVLPRKPCRSWRPNKTCAC